MPSGNRFRLSLLATLLIGAAIGAAAGNARNDLAHRRAVTAFEQRHDLDLATALETELRADLANARLAPHDAEAAATVANPAHSAQFAARVEELRTRTPSTTEVPLRSLGRVHGQIQKLAGGVVAGAPSPAAPVTRDAFDQLARELNAGIDDLNGQLRRERDGGDHASEVWPPFFVLAFAVCMGGMLCALLYVAVARSASAAAPMPARTAAARTHALLHIDQLNEALRYIADWIFICTGDGAIEHVLASTDGRAGLDRRELVGRSLWTFTADLRHDALAQSPHANGITVTLATFGATPETAIAVRMVVVRLDGGGSPRLLAIVRDRSDEIGIEQSFKDRTTQLMRARADVDRLRERVMYVAEEEQERIGQELHDGVGQQLAGISFLTHALASRIGGDDAKTGADLRWLSELTRRTAESVRGVSRQLGAKQFENSDIAALLAQLCEDTAIAFEVKCQLHAEEASCEFRAASASAKRHIFRFAQESLNNALRHGHANRVVMRLEARRQRLRLTILDNGSGFDLRRFTGATRRGLGLHSMRMRASIIGGRLHIRTGAYGTLVMLVAPVAALSEA